MPEFIPQHTPNGLDRFILGYLDCAEWLLDEEIDRDTTKGWSQDAIGKAIEDCTDFQTTNADMLLQYEDLSGRDMYCAGMDFWLTRNRHGAGFWDRGDDPCLKTLTDNAHAYGECDAYQGDDGFLYLT